MIVQFGGQTPLKLAAGLNEAGVAILGHEHRRDRPGRGPLAVRRAARRPRLQGAAVRDCDLAEEALDKRRDRSGSRCWCARATCSAAARWRSSTASTASRDYLERVVPEPGRHDLPRPLPRGLDRGRRRRALRRDRRVDRRDHAARRGGRYPLRATRRACSRRTRSATEMLGADPRADRGDRAGARSGRPAQRPVRDPRRGRPVRDRGQPARVAHGAVRVEGDRTARGEARVPGAARRASRRSRPAAGYDQRARVRQGGRAAVRPVRRRRLAARPRDALDRRGDGDRPRLPDGVRQGAGRRRCPASRRRPGLHHGRRRR